MRDGAGEVLAEASLNVPGDISLAGYDTRRGAGERRCGDQV
ncbi:hypothetical protein OIE62_27475 [Streptomyces scopuliridis]|uniref:Uncharacterized protein n=1 Tax=Streptomyces scopuliridis TaxID=452529 RepID=A0ACD4ZHK0_9ACTN|nr:hypothetical protein [Streptomyces scopuliridis]WSB97925.1 hypothetical protein OG835_13465 [Streptomyces scopuliridis]WSC08373.1 hypothetical protein OIE62_27475 [Streptomyces scopuliridis]